MTLFDKSLSSKSINFIDNNVKPIPNLLEKDHKDGYQNFENQFDNVEANGALKILSGNKLDMNDNSKTTSKNIDDFVLEEMQRQSQIDNDDLKKQTI